MFVSVCFIQLALPSAGCSRQSRQQALDSMTMDYHSIRLNWAFSTEHRHKEVR